MNFGQSYFDVLTSRIGGASSIWNRHGTSQINSRNMITGVRGTSRTSQLGFNNSHFGLSPNTIKAMNKAFNSTYNNSYMSDQSVALGAVEVENAGMKLSNDALYEEENSDQLLKTVKNFVEGYNEVNRSARNFTSTAVRNQAGWMREDVYKNISDLRKIGIGFNSKTGELSVDEAVFKGADKAEVKKTFGESASFGQRMRSNASLTSQAAVAASRYNIATSGIYGPNGIYAANSFLGGYGGYSSLLSSMFSSWI
ncbi:hypothetical protein [Butyrivibrio sp. TB]|uniref:hypothetical protein n=1 Tax=Butyrivibrio sp. TB TaxID=1520809 RepID=UPI0008D06377|nr:hypothetical protein [Butyrivibrio sp. TB]SEP76741.1 hypothetical protein SAMN02910382_00959 [Butyrivibrio sp. TB]